MNSSSPFPICYDPIQEMQFKGLHWIEASAGTGKTYTLSSLMVRIFLKDYLPNQVIATTFTRKAAAEFSFFLAVPTMLAVTVYSIFVKTWGKTTPNPMKGYEMILASNDNIIAFAVGNVVAFIVALIAIKSFIGLLNKYGFKPWGWYRIIVGIVLLIYFTQFQ